MKLLVWNINQRSRGDKIPPLVSERIMDFNTDADIVVLTEFLSAVNTNSKEIMDFKNKLSKKYYTFCNEKRDRERENANGIFIGVKKGFAEINGRPKEDLETYYKEEDQPNFLQLEIVVGGKPICIIGTRIQVGGGITSSAYIERRQQLVSLVEHIVELGNKNIIVAGDFNNAYIHGDETESYLAVRDEYCKGDINEPLVTFDTYNYHIMKGIFATAGMNAYTPEGKQYSCGFKLDTDGKPDCGCFKEDHIVSKNLTIRKESIKYHHEFIKNYNIDKEWVLHDGRYCITPPFPDHAILIADVDL